ncbi:hypothetical protein FRC02_001427 [Tulasnella sp. 418]|nr:hypothetical protein FRC02_001427 [Tulasnella sp. 418]
MMPNNNAHALLEQSIEQCDSAVAHAKLMASRCEELQQQLVQKKTKLKKQKLNVKARHLTSDTAMEIMRAQQAEKDDAQREEEEKNQRKKEEAEQRQRQREEQAPTRIWKGSYKNLKKDELQDLAYALKLDLSGTKLELVARISDHLSRTAECIEDPRFRGLFPNADVAGILAASRPTAKASRKRRTEQEEVPLTVVQHQAIHYRSLGSLCPILLVIKTLI